MALKVTDGYIRRAQKVLIYGPEGIGKSTMAAHFPKPVFCDMEDGTALMNVDRADWGGTWTSLLATVRDMPGSGYKTLVIDTADWAEQLCIKYICESKGVKGIEDFGYGKGYTYIGEEFTKLLDELNKVIASGIHVVFTAHAKMRKFEQPDEMGAYDRWETKLSKQVAPLIKEWADMVLFCNYQTVVITTQDKKKKAQGGKRVMYTTHHPCWDAKNRHALPDKLDMDYEQIRECFEGMFAPETQKQTKPVMTEQKEEPVNPDMSNIPTLTPMEELKQLSMDAGISSAEIQQACEMAKLQPKDKPLKDYGEEFIQRQLLDKWEKFKLFIFRNIKNVPADWVRESQEGVN